MEKPKKSDPKYNLPDGSFDQYAYDRDLSLYDFSKGNTNPADAPQQERSTPAGAIGPDPIVGATDPTRPAGGSRKETHWWESPTDDTTNDGGSDFANAVFEDSETKQFSAEAQAGMAAAKAAGDEAGYNGIKDAEREQLARGGGYSASNPPPNPGVAGPAKKVNVTGATEQQVAGMTMADVLRLIGNPAGYAEELAGYNPDEQQYWIDAVMRGDTASGARVVEEARKRLKG